jgi:hypothetical protein
MGFAEPVGLFRGAKFEGGNGSLYVLEYVMTGGSGGGSKARKKTMMGGG